MATTISNEKWTLSAISDLYDMPLLDLVFRAAEVHRRYHDAREVQLCTLLSIKTGGCPEDCAYCPQSSRYDTEVDTGRMLKTDEVLAAAREAQRGRLDPLLHGGGLARGDRRPRLRSGAGDRPRRARARAWRPAARSAC